MPLKTLLTLLALLATPGLIPAQTWQPGPAFPTGGLPRESAAGVNHGGDVFALGGTPFTTGGDGLAHQLHVGTATWITPASTEGAFYSIGAAVDGLGRIVVFGGEDANSDPGECYVWTPEDGNNGGLQDRSEFAPTMLFAVATDDLGRIYSIGGGAGANPTGPNPNSSRVERYDAFTDTWAVLTPLPAPLADAAACNDGLGHILVIGGFDASGTRTANVLRYDVATGTWDDTSVPDLPAPRSGLRVVRGADDRIYAIGGSDGTIQATTFVLDTSTLTWSTGPGLALARQRFACTLADDDFIWAMGGDTASNGTNTVERLFTPVCPAVTAPPAATRTWVGAGFTISVGVSGAAPLAWQWRKDGIPLVDGPSAGGGTVIGANAQELAVVGVGPLDGGAYDCVISNNCGSVTSPAGQVTVLPPPPQPAFFGARSLHPPGHVSSTAYAVDGDLVGGTTGYIHPTYNQLSHPAVWNLTTGGPPANLTPANSVGGGIASISNGTVAGWWWWPYTVPQQGTGYNRHACVWTGTSFTHTDVQSSGWEFGSLSDTDGTHHVGTQRFDESSTNSDGFYWPQSNSGAIKLTPPPSWGSGCAAIDGGQEFGSVHIGYGVVHAALWDETSSSHQDLNPAGSSWSYILGAGSGQQVGRATFGGVHQAGLWSGSAVSFVSLHPAGAGQSEARDAEGGIQVGNATFSGPNHAALWRGTAGSFVDLHDFLPPGYSYSYAYAVDVDAAGTITVVGTAYNALQGRTEALLWRGNHAALTQSAQTISATTGGTVEFTLYGTSALAGRTWLLAGSLSGTSPGIPFAPGLVIPLNLDAYTFLLLDFPNTLIMPSFGSLAWRLTATATLTLPPMPGALTAPLLVHHAFVVLDAFNLQVAHPSNAAALTVLP